MFVVGGESGSGLLDDVQVKNIYSYSFVLVVFELIMDMKREILLYLRDLKVWLFKGD